jgi:hypothetical protein
MWPRSRERPHTKQRRWQQHLRVPQPPRRKPEEMARAFHGNDEAAGDGIACGGGDVVQGVRDNVGTE